MTDFDDVRPARGAKSMRDQWSEFIAKCFRDTVDSERGAFKKHGSRPALAYVPQYYDASAHDAGATLEQAIPWNAFPKELLRRYGRERALVEADTLWPLSRYSDGYDGPDAGTTFYRPLTEYCEWHVLRDPETNAIRRVTFSSEPPEYWQALFGEIVQTTGGSPFRFRPKERRKVLELYQDLVSPRVRLEDLVAKKKIVIQQPTSRDPGFVIEAGQYNPYNRWNTQLGIAHLCAPPNSLTAEVKLGGDATVLYANGTGRTVVEPDPLICCAQYGGPDRNSDPTIGAAVNALARLGAMITLRDPVGLYMDHIDLTGWSLPYGIPAADCVRVLRGDEKNRMIERLVVEVPAKTGYTVSDIRIGGEPVRFGGQIAECITVKLVGVAALAGVKNPALPCSGRCCVDPADLRLLNDPPDISAPAPPGTVNAFVAEGAELAVQARPRRGEPGRGRRAS